MRDSWVTSTDGSVSRQISLAVTLFIIFFGFIWGQPIPSFSFRSELQNTAPMSISVSSVQNLSTTDNVWLFGYVGDVFYPTAELALSQSTVLKDVKNLSETFGKKNLVLLTAVDEIPLPSTGTISESMVPTIASYVSSLKKYASAVYGRLDMYQFNLTASGYGNCDPAPANCPIFNQTALFVNQLGLNGIWFDHAAGYWNAVGNVTFNEMMQNLTTEFPKTVFILNHTPPPSKFGIITELPGFTWEKNTYLAPSPPLTTLVPNYAYVQQLYIRFPGHLLMHMDASGPASLGTSNEQPYEPMSIFADLNSSAEISAFGSLVYNGTHPQFQNESYSTVIPILGSWSYDGPVDNSTCAPPKAPNNCIFYLDNSGWYYPTGVNYSGYLYNSFSKGKFSRATYENLVQIELVDGLQN